MNKNQLVVVESGEPVVSSEIPKQQLLLEATA